MSFCCKRNLLESNFFVEACAKLSWQRQRANISLCFVTTQLRSSTTKQFIYKHRKAGQRGSLFLGQCTIKRHRGRKFYASSEIRVGTWEIHQSLITDKHITAMQRVCLSRDSESRQKSTTTYIRIRFSHFTQKSRAAPLIDLLLFLSKCFFLRLNCFDTVHWKVWISIVLDCLHGAMHYRAETFNH